MERIAGAMVRDRRAEPAWPGLWRIGSETRIPPGNSEASVAPR
jgi:hypothetical protein